MARGKHSSIAETRRAFEEKDAELARLRREIEQLNKRLAGVKAELDKARAVLAEDRAAENRAVQGAIDDAFARGQAIAGYAMGFEASQSEAAIRHAFVAHMMRDHGASQEEAQDHVKEAAEAVPRSLRRNGSKLRPRKMYRRVDEALTQAAVDIERDRRSGNAQ